MWPEFITDMGRFSSTWTALATMSVNLPSGKWCAMFLRVERFTQMAQCELGLSIPQRWCCGTRITTGSRSSCPKSRSTSSASCCAGISTSRLVRTLQELFAIRRILFMESIIRPMHGLSWAEPRLADIPFRVSPKHCMQEHQGEKLNLLRRNVDEKQSDFVVLFSAAQESLMKLFLQPFQKAHYEIKRVSFPTQKFSSHRTCQSTQWWAVPSHSK